MSDSTFETLLGGQLRAYAEGGVRPIDRHAVAMATLNAGRARRPMWGFASHMRLAGMGVAAVVIVVAGNFLLAQKPPPDVGPVPSSSASPSASATSLAPSEPADGALRATWVANAKSMPSLDNGAGPVSLSIDASGGRIAAANFAPGAAFASSIDQVAPDQVRLVLDLDSGGCPRGAEGRYRWTLSPDGLLLTLAKVSDACATRGDALSRTWARSLTAETFRGAGVVDTMSPTFAVTLPDDSYQARMLDDFIEIGGSRGLSLLVFKNPQGFADSCSSDQVRYPYTPGAAAFVKYLKQNDAFTVVGATPLKIGGHDAIHLVTKRKVEGARCPSADLYTLTPKACDCHFFGGDDGMYLVDVGADTYLFQLSGAHDPATEQRIIDSIRIPYELPSQ